MKDKEDIYYDYFNNHSGYRDLYPKPISIGSVSFLFMIALLIALHENVTKWKLAVIKFYSNLWHHPFQIFHFEIILYIFLSFLLLKFVFRLVKKLF